MKKINNFIKYIFIPFLLLLFWIIVPVFITSNSPLSIIKLNYTKSVINDFNNREILKGQKVDGEFKSIENNLGIVSIRFNTFARINSDVLIFRIKEKQSDDWFYSAKYKVDQFQNNKFFTFGFPVIENSLNRNYVFQLISTQGSPGDAVAISQIDPVMQNWHQFDKSKIISNKLILIKILYSKILYNFSNLNLIIFSLPYLLPFIFYIFFLIINLKNKKEFKFNLLYLFLNLIVIYILINISINGVVDLILLIVWILIIIKRRIDSTVTFLFGIFLLSISIILNLFNNMLIAEKFTIWSYYFLVFGIIQYIFEMIKNIKLKFNYLDIIIDLFRKN